MEYRGHIQDIGNFPTEENTWINDGDRLGTVGESLRLEALDVKIVSVPTDLTAYKALLASIGKSVEKDYTAISWTILQKVMTDNVVSADNSQIDVNQATAAIQTAFNDLVKKQAVVIYDKAGTYGPATGTETVAGDVIIKADGVVLQNLTIQGDLTVAAEVGNGTVTLNNVNVAGDTFVRGGGVNSIHINGGTYHNVTVEKTATDQVRIVATDAQGLAVVISEDATGQSIILEGAFDSVVVNAPNMTLSTQGDTTIVSMTVSKEGAGSTLTLGYQTKVNDLVLDGKTGVNGQGTVTKAEVGADGVTFEKAPAQQTVDPVVVVPPVVTPVTPPDPGGGYTTVPVTGVTITPASASLAIGDTLQLTATVAPSNATNQNVDWSVVAGTGTATIDANGLLTATAGGTVTVKATASDGYGAVVSKDITIKVPVTGVTITPASASLAIGETLQLTATVAPGNATNQAVNWSVVTGTGTAIIDTNGLLTATAGGTVTVKATASDGYGAVVSKNITIDVPVTDTAIQGVTAPVVGATPVTTFDDTQYSGSVIWKETSDTGNTPAEVDTFTANKAYTATITLTAKTGYVFPAGISFSVLGATTPTTTIVGDSKKATITADFPSLEYAINASGMITNYYGPGGDVTIPDTVNGIAVTGIGNGVFANNSKLTDITIPASVTSIGTGTFSQCQQLSSVNFVADSKLTDIGAHAFEYCSNLKTVNFAADSKLATIGESAFYICNSLSKITIPASVTSIGICAFSLCQDLSSVNFAANSNLTDIGDGAFGGAPLTAIQIPASVTSIGNSAFSSCSRLQSVNFAANSNLVTISDNAFKKSGLKDISIPASVTSIGASAFSDCTALTAITIPDKVTSIGAGAFDACSNLTTITFNGNAPTMIVTDAIPVGTGKTIHYYADKIGFDAAAWHGYILVPILAAPANLTVTTSTSISGQIDLAWTAVSGATDYTVKCWPQTGNETNAATFKNIQATSFTIGFEVGLGTAYHFTVTATDAIGGSLPSATVDATPTTI
ncbi:leucine-rich repeat protein [Acetobacterium tundrae]|uniref:leucine-rich repeat protein n=1 Tax=Acetobacterium tundrae TaxID=132932 RepID=UPI0028800C5E|nr:leucine-rich repeat protein [Acetobacterium tundrae]